MQAFIKTNWDHTKVQSKLQSFEIKYLNALTFGPFLKQMHSPMVRINSRSAFPCGPHHF